MGIYIEIECLHCSEETTFEDGEHTYVCSHCNVESDVPTSDDEFIEYFFLEMVNQQKYVSPIANPESDDNELIEISDFMCVDVTTEIDLFITACQSKKVSFSMQNLNSVFNGYYPEVNGINVMSAA